VTAIVHIDARPRRVIDVVVGNPDALAICHEHPGALFGKYSHVMHQVVAGLTIHRDIVSFRVPTPPVLKSAHGALGVLILPVNILADEADRSEEHTSELQSLTN